MEEKFDFTTKIRGKNISFRKWKVKDKKKFLGDPKNKKNVREALVYDNLKDPIALSDEEYKYVLFQIRTASVKTPMIQNIECDNCQTDFDYEIKFDEIVTVLGDEKYTEIEVGKHIFKMSSIKNREFYEDMIFSTHDKDERVLIDFLCHIDSYNDQDFTFEQINEIINNLDVEEFEEIFTKWEKMRFKVNTVHEVQCPNCEYKEEFFFDDFPDFFPDSWEF